MEFKQYSLYLTYLLLIFFIPIIIYLVNFNLIVFDSDFYKNEFQKYGIYNALRDYDVEKINEDVLNYYKFERTNALIDNDFFNDREKLHLLDVKNVIQGLTLFLTVSIFLFLLSLILFFVLLQFKVRIFLKSFLLLVFYSNLLSLSILILLFAVSAINFDFIFNLMHETLFPIGTFSFDPEFEKIVVLYPENLFLDALVKIILHSVFSSVIALLASFLILFYYFKFDFSDFFLKFPDGELVK